MTTEVLFFHGAGEGAYAADAALASSLQRHLGSSFSITFPQLPENDDAEDADWLGVIRASIDRASAPVVLVAHSAGGYMLLKHLATERVTRPVSALCLIAPPFPGGDDNWTFDGFELPPRFGERLPRTPVFLYASEDDDIVPFAHMALYAEAIPWSVPRTATGGHQLGNDLGRVADDIRSCLITVNDGAPE
jgi:predicted alpha/beta hydrolase family esterase